MNAEHDVIVVGAGGAGCMAALRARRLGLKVLLVEKSHQIGGTTATSGGLLWIPNNGLVDNGDSRDKALAYLRKIVSPEVRQDRLEAYRAANAIGVLASAEACERETSGAPKPVAAA